MPRRHTNHLKLQPDSNYSPTHSFLPRTSHGRLGMRRKQMYTPSIKPDFKLAIKLHHENSRCDTPSIEIYPTKINSVQHFVMQWTKQNQPMVEFVFSIDEIDNLINWFLVDRIPCYKDDFMMDIYTVVSDKHGVFEEDAHKIYGQSCLCLDSAISISSDHFKRILLNCASMSLAQSVFVENPPGVEPGHTVGFEAHLRGGDDA